jgi:hypothetical protein
MNCGFIQATVINTKRHFARQAFCGVERFESPMRIAGSATPPTRSECVNQFETPGLNC